MVKDNTGEKSDRDKASEAIAKEMSKAVATSGAGSMPDASAVPVAWTTGDVVGNNASQTGQDALIFIPPGGVNARNEELANNPLAATYAPMEVALQKQMADALAKQAPAAPPVQVAIGGVRGTIPGSLQAYPHKLHTTNTPMAQALWRAFAGPHRKNLSTLAAKAGFPEMPFLYLTQALWTLIEIRHFAPQPGENKFKLEDRNASDTYRGLMTWAGPELTRSIIGLCEREKIDVIEFLHQCFAQLEDDRLATVGAAAKFATAYEWSGDDD